MTSTQHKRRKPSLSPRVDKAYEAIKERILDNTWPPGFQAFEPQVADALDMSRTPVREALLRLENEGLVRMIPRRGMYVVPLSPDDMRDIYDVLAALESMAAELLARRIPSEQELSPMENSLEEMDAALAKNDLTAWAKADATFHHTLLDLCRNNRLATMAFTVWDQAHRARMISLKLRPLPVDSTNEHRAVLNAIRSGNWEEAKRIQYEHRRRGKELVLNALKRFGLPQL